MKLGMSTAAFYGRWETEESAEYIASLGLDCAEVFLQSSSEYERTFAKLTRERLGATRCTSVHPLGTQFESQMFSRSPRQKQDAFDVFRRVLDAGAELGAQMYVYHGRNTPQLKPCPWNLQANLDVLAEMEQEAKMRGMMIAWENVYWCQLTQPERVREAAEACPQLRFTLDIKQAMRAGCDAFEMAQAMGGRIVNVHVCDWNDRGELCLPGEGIFDFAALFSLLKEEGYHGPVITEPYLTLIKSEKALCRSLQYVRSLIE